MPTRLVDLLREDGVKLRGKGPEIAAKCPFHDDRTPSMSVNVEKEVYNCHGCGAEGDAVTYLMDKRGLSQKEALREVKGEMHSTQPKPRKKESRPSRPYWISGLPENAITRHRYLLGDGSLAFVVCRFPKGAQAKCKPYTPAKRGGSDGWTMNLAIREGRPLYRLGEMNKASSGKQVMVVEGEKCADAVASAFPKAVVTTWHGGAKAWKYTDWSPLEGRRVLLVSDADSEGRKCMLDLARHLKGLECTDIRIALPEGEDHRDIADEIAEGGGQAAGEWLKRLAAPWKPPEPEKTASKQPKKKKDPPPPANAADNDYFRILGNVGDSVAVRLATHQIMLYSRSALTQPSTLISLAAYNWWLDLLTQESLTPSSCHSVGSALIRAADRQGQLDLSRVAGRGFFRNDNNRYVWNLGDRLLVDGREGELDSLQDGRHYVNGPRIEVAEKRAGHGERKRVAEAVERYRWQHPLDGRRFLGWLVSSIVGGALEWRPHIWLAAAAETGKSWLLKRVAARLLGPMVVRVADATPAAMARRMRSDSLPLILDEAEPDRQWIEGLMDLIRVAAGGDGERIRTDVGGNVQRLHPRFSVCMSSTKIANLRAADASRFQMLNLSLKGVENWPEVERAIEDSLANGACERIRAALIHEGHEVVEEAASVSRELMRGGHGTRGSLIGGALTAGWRWLSGETDMLPPVTETLVGQSQDDAGYALREILNLRVQTHGAERVPLIDLLTDQVRYEEKLPAGYGVRLDDDDDLLIATRHPSLLRELRRTAFERVDLRRLLCQIEGASPTTNRRRFNQMRMRAVCIPSEVLKMHGVDLGRTGPEES